MFVLFTLRAAQTGDQYILQTFGQTAGFLLKTKVRSSWNKRGTGIWNVVCRPASAPVIKLVLTTQNKYFLTGGQCTLKSATTEEGTRSNSAQLAALWRRQPARTFARCVSRLVHAEASPPPLSAPRRFHNTTKEDIQRVLERAHIKASVLRGGGRGCVDD